MLSNNWSFRLPFVQKSEKLNFYTIQNLNTSGNIVTWSTWPEANILAPGLSAFKSNQACLCFDRFLANYCIRCGGYYFYSFESLSSRLLLKQVIGLKPRKDRSTRSKVWTSVFGVFQTLMESFVVTCNWHQHNLTHFTLLNNCLGFSHEWWKWMNDTLSLIDFEDFW